MLINWKQFSPAEHRMEHFSNYQLLPDNEHKSIDLQFKIVLSSADSHSGEKRNTNPQENWDNFIFISTIVDHKKIHL